MRKLTAKEQRRAEIVGAKVQAYKDQGYSVTNLTVDMQRANLMAIVLVLPFIVVFLAAWLLKNPLPEHYIKEAFAFPVIVAILLSIIIHECIHGICWVLFAPDRFKSIEFGFTTLAAYCTCTEPLQVSQYCIGLAAPGLILGIIPSIAAVMTGSIPLLFYGLIQILGAGGDLQILIKLLTYKSDKTTHICVDHPTEIGLLMIEK